MQLSPEMNKLAGFFDCIRNQTSVEFVEDNTTEFLKTASLHICELDFFVNSVQFLNEYKKLSQHYRRLAESEVLRRQKEEQQKNEKTLAKNEKNAIMSS